MSKENSSFFLILLLFVILTGWWAASSFRTPQANPVAQHSLLSMQSPLQILHVSKGGVHTFSGALDIPSCDNLSTGVSVFGSPAQLHLSLNLSQDTADCDRPGTVSQPFVITFSAKKSPSAPVLSSVTINNQAAAFSVLEPH